MTSCKHLYLKAKHLDVYLFAFSNNRQKPLGTGGCTVHPAATGKFAKTFMGI